ncbi:hypothetical protein KC319_g13038 [Hortaea werneckii]|nr:hypothetical protein KC317_g13232 [Hortaea werneckii]KAI7600101.1 hypothetical protein KC346_g13417 [Hortaea werneckii]KAI7642458.1 hypothetical protein KC319_g13038 [Hortaea werneckii]KAI7683414.1 hypothetical protein KC322_g13734 [Hortaea werneckii]
MNVILLLSWHLATCLHRAAAASSAKDIVPTSPAPYNEAVDNGTYGYYPIRTFATANDVAQPQTNFLQWSEKCDDGLLYFLTPRGWSLPTPGPMILDRYGDLLWAHHYENKYGGQAYDFKVQEYKGEKYLTFWLGDDRVRGHGSGSYYMLNSSYDIVRKVKAANGLSADLHEFLITKEGTALMTMYQVIPHDVTEFREFDSEKEEDSDPNYIWDCLFQEIDIETGDLIFEWRASEHVPINSTFHDIGPGGTKNDAFDWFHINSIEKDELGNYLVSARYVHSLTYVNGKTGEIIWTLGGNTNDFMDLSGEFALNFAWQHDARFLPLDTFPNMYTPPDQKPGFTTRLVTMFDNAAEDQHYQYGLTYSRGLVLEITYPTQGTFAKGASGPTYNDLTRRFEDPDYTDSVLNHRKLAEINGTDPNYTARVIKSFESPDRVRSSSQGSMQILPQTGGKDPKVLIGYGLNAVWTEFEADGSVLCDVHFGATTSWERGDIQSYRVYKFPWIGRPKSKPDVEISDDDAEVFVSWNGATEVATWILQCSQRKSKVETDWADVVSLRKSGFETIIPIPESMLSEPDPPRYLRVIALDSAGRRLDHGISRVIDRGLMASYFPLLDQKLPHQVSRMSPGRMVLIATSILVGMFLLYEAYRRYLSWKLGKVGGGPFRWKTGAGYRLLGDM